MTSTVTRWSPTPVDEAFAVISNPRTYPNWLVGARAIRSVDERWPAPGSRFHHRVGIFGPLTVADSTSVLEIEPPSRLVLEVRFRPFGRGRVEFVLSPGRVTRGGGPVATIELSETPIGPLAIAAPVLDRLVEARNRASLNALVAYLTAPEDRRPGLPGAGSRG